MSPLRWSRRRGLARLAGLIVVVVGIVLGAVWLAASHSVVPGLTAKLYPIHYSQSIAQAAERYRVDPYLVAAVVKTESGYDPRALSRVGALGLMQLMPDTATWITGLATWKGKSAPVLTNPQDNLELGACYLAFLLQHFGRNTTLALAAYNAGQGTVENWVKGTGKETSFGLSDIRFPETRNFVQKVQHYWTLYPKLHPDIFAATTRTES